MSKPIRLLAALLLAAPAALAQDARPPLVAQALAQKPGAAAFAFEGEIVLGERAVSLRVDPNAAGAARVVVLNPPEASLSADQRAAIAGLRNEEDLSLWCADPNLAARDFALVSEDAATATFRFQPLPDPDMGQDERFTKNLTGELVVSKSPPDVLSLKVYAPAPFKPNLLAKIDRFESTTTCAPAPDGRQYAARVSSRVAGSAMFAAFDQSVVQTITKVLPAETGD